MPIDILPVGTACALTRTSADFLAIRYGDSHTNGITGPTGKCATQFEIAMTNPVED